MVDYYKILEVNRNAAVDDVKKAYRRFVLVWHPDKNPSIMKLEAKKMFKKILNAYQILNDPNKRLEYDREQAINYVRDRDLAFLQEMAALRLWRDELEKKILRMLEDIRIWRDKLEKKISQLHEDIRVWHDKRKKEILQMEEDERVWKKLRQVAEDDRAWHDKRKKEIRQMQEDDGVWHDKRKKETCQMPKERERKRETVHHCNIREVNHDNVTKDDLNKAYRRVTPTPPARISRSSTCSSRYQRPTKSSLSPTSAPSISTMVKDALKFSHLTVAPWEAVHIACDELEKKILQTRLYILIRRDKHKEQIHQIREDDRVKREKYDGDAQERTRQWNLESRERLRRLNFAAEAKMRQLNLETKSFEKKLYDLHK